MRNVLLCPVSCLTRLSCRTGPLRLVTPQTKTCLRGLGFARSLRDLYAASPGAPGGHELPLIGKGLVGEEVDAQFEVGAVEVGGEWGELAHSGDAAPAGSVDGLILAGAVEVHDGDAAVGQNREANEGLALFVQGRGGPLRG